MARRPPADAATPQLGSAPEARVVFSAAGSSRSARSPDGAWWPRTRVLADELAAFVAAWPSDRGRIQRVLYSTPDWDDHPHSVVLPGRRMKTGTFPREDTRLLVVSMADRSDHLIVVVPPDTDPGTARRLMAAAIDSTNVTPAGSQEDRREGEGGDATPGGAR